MPKEAEKKIARQGGAKDYRTVKKGGHTYTCAITRKAGPNKGRTVCWRRD